MSLYPFKEWDITAVFCVEDRSLASLIPYIVRFLPDTWYEKGPIETLQEHQ
ncbi:MAG: hypothetical protein NVS2B12_14980 [Ktedonobacteraceae bacterium]